MRVGSGWTRNLLIIACAVVILAVISIPVFNLAVYTPANTAKQYLRALASHNAERALGLISAPEAEPGNAMVADVLENAPSIPEDIAVEATSRIDDNRTDVTLSYRLGTESQQTTLHMARTADTWGLYRTWNVSLDQWPTLTMDVSGADVVSINEVAVPVAESGIPVLFPMEYTVGFNAEYLESDAQRVTVTGDEAQTAVELTAKPTEALRKRAEEIVRDQIDECVGQKTLMPTGCSFGYETNNDIIGDVSWSVESYPQVDIKESSGGLSLQTTDARLTVSGRYRDSVTAAESDFAEDIDSRITGTVSVVDDDVVVTQSDEELGS